MKTIKGFIFGSIFGFMLGGLICLLLTPNSGLENRQKIGQQFSETAGKVQEAVRLKREELQREIDLFTG